MVLHCVSNEMVTCELNTVYTANIKRREREKPLAVYGTTQAHGQQSSYWACRDISPLQRQMCLNTLDGNQMSMFTQLISLSQFLICFWGAYPS